jgi:beta-lactamase regulating signal transducer with metallopeptidase domain
MSAVIEQINSGGYTFVEFAASMLIQASVLIVLLFLADLALRKRVRAVFRYWMWLLVLVKLVLPTSLSGPFSIGYWFGDKLEYVDVGRGAYEPQAAGPMMPALPYIDISNVPPAIYPPAMSVGPAEVDVTPAQPIAPPSVPPVQIEWQGVVFLLWLAIVTALVLLLVQRAIFVHGLVAQARDANRPMYDALEECRSNMKVRAKVGLKVSPNAASPAVCGLLRPVILVPQNLASALDTVDLRIVLLHELAHVKRGDLWVNLAQTLLQIVYFYNPLLWLANTVIRRAREQAVDEAMLVAMGEEARRYPRTLVSVAKLAFKRPALSLRLIGVVESESALTGRIKHILSRPMPKSTKLGILGLAVIVITAAILLPMAKAQPYTDRARQVMALAEQEARRLKHEYVGTEHILIALAGQKDGVAAKVLDKLGVQKETVEAELAKLVRPGSKPITKGNLPQTPRAKKALELAEHEAKGLGHDYIGTEHILLGVVREKECLAAQMLAKLGVSYDVARAAVLDFVKPGPGVKTDAEVEVESEQISAAVGVQDSALSRSTSAEAAFVIQKVLDRYASIKTYSAIGELLTVVDRPLEAMGAIPGMTTEMLQQMGERQLKSIFTIKMARPNLYCIEWNEHIDTGLSKVGNAWSVGDGSYGLILGKEKSFEKPLRALIATAGNMGRAQSSLFFDTSLNTLRKLRDLSQQEDEQLEGIECYVISGSLYRRTYTYWVSKKDFMIRRYKYVSGGDGKPVEGGGDELTEETIRHYLEATDKEATPEEIAKTRAMLTAAEAMASEVKVTNTETYRNIVLDRPISKGQFVPSKDIDEISEKLKKLRAQYIDRLENISPAEANLKTDVEVKPGSARPKYSATLANGVTVELVGICAHPSEGKQWWGLDGQAVARPYERLNRDERSGDSELYEIVYRLFGCDDILSTIYSNSEITGHISVNPLSQKTEKLNIPDAANAYGAILLVKPDAQFIQLEMGIGRDSDWKTLCTQASPVDKTGTGGPGVVFQPAIEKDGNTHITIAHQIKDGQIRVIAVDHSGQIHKSEGFLNTISGELGSCQVRFDLPAAQIKEIQFQTQKFQRVTFKNIPLRPGTKTDVEIEVESEKISGVVDVQDSALGKSTSAEAAFIIQKVLDRYASIKTYSAIGESLTDVNHPPGGMGAIPGMTTEMLQQMGEQQLKSIFTIKMARPNLYCIKWNEHIDTNLSKVGNTWSVGDGSYGLILGKEKSFEKPLQALIWTASDMGKVQSSLFFDTSLNTLRELRDLSQQEDEQLEGVECYVISGSRHRTTYTYWVSKKDFLIRRYKFVSGGDGKPVEGGGHELTEERIRRYLKATDREATPEEIAKTRAMLTAANAMASEVKVTNTETYRNIILDQHISKEQFVPSKDIDEITEELKNLQAQYIHRLENISPTESNLKTDVRVEVETPDEKAGFVWGEVVDGLRAAVEFVPEKQTYSILEKIDVHFHIQNISDKPIQFISESYRSEPLKIEDANGNRQGVRENVYSGSPPVTRHYLEPGREVVLRGLPLSIAQDEQQLESLGEPYGTDFKAKPGVYFVRSRLTIPGVISSSLPAQKDDWTGQLETGRHKLVVAAGSGAAMLFPAIGPRVDFGTGGAAADSYPTPEQIRQNWHRFRGPGGSGISAYTNVPDDWDGQSGRGIL